MDEFETVMDEFESTMEAFEETYEAYQAEMEAFERLMAESNAVDDHETLIPTQTSAVTTAPTSAD